MAHDPFVLERVKADAPPSGPDRGAARGQCARRLPRPRFDARPHCRAIRSCWSTMSTPPAPPPRRRRGRCCAPAPASVDVLTFARVTILIPQFVKQLWHHISSAATRIFDEPGMPRVTIYTRQFCGYCTAAKRLLTELGVEFEEIDATGAPDKRQEMIDRSGRFTFPQIFIGDAPCGRLRRSLRICMRAANSTSCSRHEVSDAIHRRLHPAPLLDRRRGEHRDGRAPGARGRRRRAPSTCRRRR